MGDKVKNAQNHRQIDARGKAEGSEPVIYCILYYVKLSKSLLNFSPFFGPCKSLLNWCQLVPHVETLIFQKFQLESVSRFGDTSH